jgi:hypothetical protein
LIRKKQVTDQAEWERALAVIRSGRYPQRRLDLLIETSVADIVRTVGRRRAAYSWSGGKDSIALGYVAEAAGIADCVMGISNLEYPAFLQWVTAHMPRELEVINTGQDLEWLARNPEMLFPANSNIAAKWFKIVQHTAQARFFRDRSLDVLLLGRRRADGNYLGAQGELIYTSSDGITRYSPIGRWEHIDVLALVERIGNWPPIYGWPRGFQVGTHSWPARQWCGSVEAGWREVYSIDPQIVRDAEPYLDSAARFLECAASSGSSGNDQIRPLSLP